MKVFIMMFPIMMEINFESISWCFVPYYDENKSSGFVSWLFIPYYDKKYLIITVYSSDKDNDIYFLKTKSEGFSVLYMQPVWQDLKPFV